MKVHAALAAMFVPSGLVVAPSATAGPIPRLDGSTVEIGQFCPIYDPWLQPRGALEPMAPSEVPPGLDPGADSAWLQPR